MIKFFSRLKRRKGFTLTEMIVVTAIIGIIMASVVAFSGPMRDSIKNTEAKADALTINEVLGNYLEHNLAYACKIDAFVGYTYENDVTAIRDAYDPSGGVSNGYKGLAGEANTTVRMFVAHFDGPTDSSDPIYSVKKGTMKFYDVKLDGSGLPALSTVATNDNLVFTEDFFGNYQYFMTIDDDDLGKNTNSRTKKAYMNIRLDSYNFGPDDASNMSGETVKNYYRHIITNGAVANPFEAAAIVSEKIGSEMISFSLENIKASEANVSGIKTDSLGNKQYYSNGAPIFETYLSAGGAQIHKPSAVALNGNDLVILYAVKKYTVV